MDYTTYWNGKSVFVTGAGGFIGSHLTEALVRAGAKVRAMVHYNGAGDWGWLDQSEKALQDAIDIKLGDIRDAGYVRDFIAGCNYGFHLAALIAIPYSYVAPRSYVETNVLGTLNVLEACKAGGIERLVHTSTSEVYGTAQQVPIPETHPLQGQSPYSASKIGADQMADSFYRSFELPVVTLRPFNTYGPRQSMRAVIPTVIRQGLAGETVRLGNLTPTRDFNFIDDTVQGFLRAGSTSEAVGQVINIGSGVEISIADLLAKVETLLGRPLNLVQEDQRLRPENSEVFRLCADTAKAQAILNYAPQISLDEGLQRTIDWCRCLSDNGKVMSYAV